MKLDFLLILPCAIDSEAGIVRSLFLIFGEFEPRCSYKIVKIPFKNFHIRKILENQAHSARNLRKKLMAQDKI